MAMDSSVLGPAIFARLIADGFAIPTLPVDPGPLIWTAIADEIIKHIKDNATISLITLGVDTSAPGSVQ